MPIYEFYCEDCKKEFEYLVMGSDKPVCPTCNNNNVYKLMSTCGFVSKGSGGVVTEKRSASTSSCSGCTAGSCSTCGSN